MGTLPELGDLGALIERAGRNPVHRLSKYLTKLLTPYAAAFPASPKKRAFRVEGKNNTLGLHSGFCSKYWCGS